MENISGPDGPVIMVIGENDWPSFIFTGHGPALKTTPAAQCTAATNQPINSVFACGLSSSNSKLLLYVTFRH